MFHLTGSTAPVAEKIRTDDHLLFVSPLFNFAFSSPTNKLLD